MIHNFSELFDEKASVSSTTEKPSEEISTGPEAEEAAVKIQAAFRGMKAREEIKLLKAEKSAITEVQTETTGGAVHVALSPTELTPQERVDLEFSPAPKVHFSLSSPKTLQWKKTFSWK